MPVNAPKTLADLRRSIELAQGVNALAVGSVSLDLVRQLVAVLDAASAAVDLLADNQVKPARRVMIKALNGVPG